MKHRNTIIAVLIWIAAWQLGAMLVHNELLLPGPAATIKTLGTLALTGVFYINIAWTVARCLIAMIVSFFAGAFFAWLSYRYYWARKIASLPVGFFKAVPVMAIIIYVILIAQADWVAIIVCFLMCFPIVYTNILAGLDAMPAEYLELAQVYRLSTGQKLRHIFMPGILPQIKAAISLIAGLSWKAVVAAEILSVPKYSLGYEMMNAKYYLQTPTLFAYIVVIVVLSMVFERLIKAALGHIEWKAYEGSKIHLHAKAGAGDAASAGREISLKNVSKVFDEKIVFEGLNFSLEEGKVTALMGPSGRGKTTLARILANLEKADSGQVSVTENAAVLFQEDRLLPWLNVRDNIALSRLGRGAGEDREKRIDQLAEML
ncbi:MAG: ABC transporter permease subunit, partial [Bacillota bacterium]|nr:ABC transporter permease subunit [Bacillota bacterium]